MNKHIIIAGLALAGGFFTPAHAEKAKSPPAESKPVKISKLEGHKVPKRTVQDVAIPVTVSSAAPPQDRSTTGKVSDLSRP